MSNPEQHVSTLYGSDHTATKVSLYCYETSTPLRQDIKNYHEISNATQPKKNSLSKLEAQFLSFYVKSHGITRVLEIGSHIGFGTLVFCEAVGRDGHVTTMELQKEDADSTSWELNKRGFANYDIMVGDAHEQIQKINLDTPYDMIFIDAEKEGYPEYLEMILHLSRAVETKRLLRPGGHILASNSLRLGLVADSTWQNPNFFKAKEDKEKKEVESVWRFNYDAMISHRFRMMVLPAFDGLTMLQLLD